MPQDLTLLLNNLTATINEFVQQGIPEISMKLVDSERQFADSLQSLSTMATFLSAVTATTLGFSYQAQTTRTEQATNVLWLTSLVFSIASAANSQLAYYLDLAHYRTPESRIARGALIWITGTPVIYIVASIIAFSAGLVCFTFTTFPAHRFIPIIVASLSSVTLFTLLATIVSFAGERYKLWTVAWHWLGDQTWNIWTAGRRGPQLPRATRSYVRGALRMLTRRRRSNRRRRHETSGNAELPAFAESSSSNAPGMTAYDLDGTRVHYTTPASAPQSIPSPIVLQGHDVRGSIDSVCPDTEDEYPQPSSPALELRTVSAVGPRGRAVSYDKIDVPETIPEAEFPISMPSPLASTHALNTQPSPDQGGTLTEVHATPRTGVGEVKKS